MVNEGFRSSRNFQNALSPAVLLAQYACKPPASDPSCATAGSEVVFQFFSEYTPGSVGTSKTAAAEDINTTLFTFDPALTADSNIPVVPLTFIRTTSGGGKMKVSLTGEARWMIAEHPKLGVIRQLLIPNSYFANKNSSSYLFTLPPQGEVRTNYGLVKGAGCGHVGDLYDFGPASVAKF